jgi:hypothetical protein
VNAPINMEHKQESVQDKTIADTEGGGIETQIMQGPSVHMEMKKDIGGIDMDPKGEVKLNYDDIMK